MRWRAALAATVLWLASAAAPAVACTGDCDADGTVTVDEIVTGVNIALGTSSAGVCPALDPSGDNAVTVDEILQAVANGLVGCPPPAPTPIFPADYRATFREVRDCRFSIEHGGVSIRVLANEIAADPYLAGANPLPEGSIVLKEEFTGPDCNDTDLDRWRVMRKEAAGFDPQFGDWAWQWVDADGSVRFNDKTTCIGCHIVPECLSRDYMCTEEAHGVADSKLILEDLAAALLSIAGTGPSEMYAVGADPGDGNGPLVLRYDGTAWRRMATGQSGDLWWISVEPIDGAYYLSGAGGLVLRLDLASRTFTRLPTPSSEPILYGIWGSAADDLWVVGGAPDVPASGGVIWHFDGTTWNSVDTSTIRAGGVPTLFKVWGRAADEIFAVGASGVMLRYDGSLWQEIASGTTRPLFTVHGNDDIVVATGGFLTGVIVESDGGPFAPRQATDTPQMNGVFVSDDDGAVAAGVTGTYSARSGGTWELVESNVDTFLDFHAAFVDAEGGVWSVGGDLTTQLSLGMLAYAGTRSISSVVVDVPRCPPPAAGGTSSVSYFNEIRPLFERSGCMSLVCHGGPFPASGYDLRSYTSTFGPGVEANIFKECDVVPGSPDDSFLIEKLLPSPRLGQRMPNGQSPLSDADIALLRTWILDGAPDDSPALTPTPTPPLGSTPVPTRTPTPTAPPEAVPTLSAKCADDGVICTMAGTGAARFDGDGPALARSFYYPIDIEFDRQGRPYIVDWNNLRIRRLERDGQLRTIMGLDYEDFPVDGALAKDTPLHHASDMSFAPDGSFLVAGDHVPVVFRVGTDDRVHVVAGNAEYGNDGDGGQARQARLQTPFGVLAETNGFFIADVDAHVIRYVDANGIIQTVAGTGVAGYSGDGGPATAARLGGPSRMIRLADGSLAFAETKSHVIRRIDPQGIISTLAGSGRRGYSGDGGPATAAQLDTPYDLALAPTGDLYIADTANNVIRRIDAQGIITTVVGNGFAGFLGDGGNAGVCEFDRPSALAFGPDGSLWVCDTSNQRLRRIHGFLSQSW